MKRFVKTNPSIALKGEGLAIEDALIVVLLLPVTMEQLFSNL